MMQPGKATTAQLLQRRLFDWITLHPGAKARVEDLTREQQLVIQRFRAQPAGRARRVPPETR